MNEKTINYPEKKKTKNEREGIKRKKLLIKTNEKEKSNKYE